MLTNQELTALLRNHGYKVTPQRLAVYEALAEKSWHPNAEMLYNKLQPKYPAMSFATVYKTVEILRDIEAIQIINTGEDSYRYDAETVSHPHIRCVVCNRVDDVFDVNDEDLLEAAAAKSGYEVTGRQLYFFGRCPECRKKLGSKERH